MMRGSSLIVRTGSPRVSAGFECKGIPAASTLQTHCWHTRFRNKVVLRGAHEIAREAVSRAILRCGALAVSQSFGTGDTKAMALTTMTPAAANDAIARAAKAHHRLANCWARAASVAETGR